MRDNKIFYNRTLYTLLALLVFSWVMLFIYAYNEDGTGGEPSVMGHSWDEVACAECINVNNIQDGAISTIKIQDGAVTEDKISTGAITEDKISNNAVTTDKISTGAISTIKIQDNAVTTSKISNNAVSTIKIQDNAVTDNKIQSVHWNKITNVPNDLGGGLVTCDWVGTKGVGRGSISCDGDVGCGEYNDMLVMITCTGGKVTHMSFGGRKCSYCRDIGPAPGD